MLSNYNYLRVCVMSYILHCDQNLTRGYWGQRKKNTEVLENIRVQISRLQKQNKKQTWLSDEITVGRPLFSFNSSSHQIYLEQELKSHIKSAQLKLASMSQHGERHWPCDRSPKSKSTKAANLDTKWLHSGQVDAGVQEWAEKTLQCS